MRDDFDSFKALGTEILVVTRHDVQKMKDYWSKEKLPFRGISDPEGKITKRYGQQWKFFSLGRMPAQMLVDCQGSLALSHYGKGMSDIIPNAQILESLKQLRTESGCPELSK